jgi:hypothetical protein
MTIDAIGLADWLDGLPDAAARREQARAAQEAAEALHQAAGTLSQVSELLPELRTACSLLGQRPEVDAAAWAIVRDVLERLPKPDMKALVAFSAANGRGFPVNAERLLRATERAWHAACQNAFAEIVQPLETLRDALANGSPDAVRLRAVIVVFLRQLLDLKQRMQSDRALASSFGKVRNDALGLLAKALAGVAQPEAFVQKVRGGAMSLNQISEADLLNLRRSLLAPAVRLVLN